ncbi:hypothetical protein IC575_002763 [Cucumis melo]
MYLVAIGRPVGSLRHSRTWGLTSRGGYGFDMGMERGLPACSGELTSRERCTCIPTFSRGGRTGSSGSKRKREVGETSSLSDTSALDQTNEQLGQIAEWQARNLANDNHVRTEFFRILREMPELTSLDRALLQRHLLSRMDDLRGFVLMPEDEREGFCRVLLRDIER